ncbi:MAG: hypothetical protein AAGF96_18730 [Bacteroidota bacterium]
MKDHKIIAYSKLGLGICITLGALLVVLIILFPEYYGLLLQCLALAALAGFLFKTVANAEASKGNDTNKNSK